MDGLRSRIARLFWSTVWRRRATSMVLVVAVQACVLGVTYQTVIFQGRTLLTGSANPGTEGAAAPYGYPGAAPQGRDEVDPDASAWQFVPQIKKASLEVGDGELPLWDANVMLGAPLAADAPAGIYDPLTWPLIASPTPATWDAWLLLRLLTAGLLCTLMAWYLGLRLLPATLAGLIFMMSGAFELRVTTIQASVMAMLPLVILAAEACIRHPSRWSSGLLGMAIALSVLAGMPEESFVCLSFAALYFLVRLAVRWIADRPARPVREAIAGAGGAVMGTLLSLPLLVPLMEYITLSNNQHGSASAGGLVYEDRHQALSLIGPHWNVVGPQSWGTGVPVDNWFGAGAILLAFLGLGSTSLPRSTRGLLAVSAVAVEAKALGIPPFYNQLIGSLPILNRISLWEYTGVIVSLCVALLAGAGLQRLQLHQIKPRHVAVATILLLAAIAIAAPIYLNGTMVRWDQVAMTFAVLAAVAGGAAYAGRRTGWCSRCGLLVASAAVVAELIFLASPEVPLPRSYDPLTPTPTTAYLASVDPSGSGRTYSATDILYPTTNQAFDLDDIRNLDAFYVERTYEYLKTFVVPEMTDRFTGQAPSAANYVHNPFFDALNVEYILVARPMTQSGASLPPDQFQLSTTAADGVAIYRNLNAAPRAQVVFSAVRVGSEAEDLAQMSQPNFDPMTQAVVEASALTQVPSSQQQPAPATIELYTDDEVVIKTSTTEPGTLVLADAYYPGWVAQLDGKPAAIYPTDLALRGVIVPAGTHTVVMRYEPASVVVGALGVPAAVAVWAIGGWGVPAGVALVQRRRRGRRRAPGKGRSPARGGTDAPEADQQAPLPSRPGPGRRLP